MPDAEDLTGSGLRRERRLVLLYVICVMVTLAREIFRRWTALLAMWNSQPLAPPELHAPDAYRVGIPWLQHRLILIFHAHSSAPVIASTDFLFGLGMLWLLYRLTVDAYRFEPDSRSRRTVAVVMSLAAMHFPLLWTLDWMRPNTLGCGFSVALMAWLITRSRQHWGWTVGLGITTVWQSFVRSDYTFVFGLAVTVAAAFGLLQDFAPKRRMLAVGLAVVSIAVGVQAYLQFVAFPHLTYPPGVPAYMLRINMGRPYLVAFAVAMLPASLVMAGAWKQRKLLQSIDWLCVLVPLVYVPLWLAVASAMEIRVFFPVYVLLVPVAGRVVARYLVSPSSPGMAGEKSFT